MIRPPAKILLVEDDLTMARTYQAFLADEPYRITHVDTGRAALEALGEGGHDVVLLDLELPDIKGFDVLEAMAERGLGAEVIVITGHGSMQVAIEAMRLGAKDFMVKPFSKERLMVTLRSVVERLELTEIVRTYRETIDRRGYGDFIGSSLKMQAVYRTLDAAASSKATVFVTGESGTGKELCAEAVHRRSDRAAKPFIAINCAAIPKDLMESEIFGHVKGAFTGAQSDRDGAAQLAHGGTLFLDEICEMDLSLQTKLLRFIQTGTFQKVGDGRDQSVDVRFVCATNRDPLEEVRAGRFREDLYYRLHVLPVHLPPLRDRDADVIEIAGKFLADVTREEGKGFRAFAPETEAILSAYDWPGNVRQLQNVVRNIVVLHDGEKVTPEMLPSPLGQVDPEATRRPAAPHAATAAPRPPGALFADRDDIRPLADLEREAIQGALELCGGNVPEVAYRLGISAATIYRKKAAWRAEAGKTDAA